MSSITVALEHAVASVTAQVAEAGDSPTARQRVEIDRAFLRITQIIAPRIRHFIRQYGLAAHWDDAEQCCAIAVHRAIQNYDSSKAQFTTFVNWQIRGELQSLRFRLLTDRRPSARKVDATTVSLHQLASSSDGEVTLEPLLVDPDAFEATEAGAADYLARAATETLVDEFVRAGREAALARLRRKQPKRALAKIRSDKPYLKSALIGLDPAELEKIELKFAQDREILLKAVFGHADDPAEIDDGLTRDRVRQIGKRACRAMAALAATNPKFALMADYRTPREVAA